MGFADDLAAIRAQVGKAPRPLRGRDKVEMPKWARTDARFREHVKRQDFVRKRGAVVWGTLVQANNNLFAPGLHNHPGNLIFSFDSVIDADPALLQRAADRLYETKGQQGHRDDTQAVADILHNEMTAFANQTAPLALTEGVTCHLADVMFDRRHLPDGVIHGRIMPLYVHRESVATTVVPSWYWSEAFVRMYWRAR